MTNEEAITRIEEIIGECLKSVADDNKDVQALRLAVTALKKGDRYNEGYLAGQACAKWRSGV